MSLSEAEVQALRARLQNVYVRLDGGGTVEHDGTGDGTLRIRGVAARTGEVLDKGLPEFGSDQLVLSEGCWTRSMAQLSDRSPVVLLYNHDHSRPAYASHTSKSERGRLDLSEVTATEFRWSATLDDSDPTAVALYKALQDDRYSGSSLGGTIRKYKFDGPVLNVVELGVDRNGDVSVVPTPANPRCRAEITLSLSKGPEWRRPLIEVLLADFPDEVAACLGEDCPDDPAPVAADEPLTMDDSIDEGIMGEKQVVQTLSDDDWVWLANARRDAERNRRSLAGRR